jgi:serine/threonine protein kinase
MDWSFLYPLRGRGQSEWCPRRRPASVSFGDYIYILGGFAGEEDEEHHSQNLNDVWRSQDGKRWELVTSRAPWSGRDGHCGLTHRGAMYIMGGTNDPLINSNDVYRTTDGRTWELVTDSAPWVGRWQHAALSHNDALYLLGGWSIGGHLNDVWMSSDEGSSWSLLTSDAEWSPRMFHTVVSLGGKMYLMGGLEGKSGHLRNDVWVSSSGEDWTLVTDNADWSPRAGHATVVSSEGKIVVCGGAATNGTCNNEVWMSENGRNWKDIGMALWCPRKGHAASLHRGAIFVLGGVRPSDDPAATESVVYLSDCYSGIAQSPPLSLSGSGTLAGGLASFHRLRLFADDSLNHASYSSFFTADSDDEGQGSLGGLFGQEENSESLDIFRKISDVALQREQYRRLQLEVAMIREHGLNLLEKFQTAMTMVDSDGVSLLECSRSQSESPTRTDQGKRPVSSRSPCPPTSDGFSSLLDEVSASKEQLIRTQNEIRLACLRPDSGDMDAVVRLIARRTEEALHVLPLSREVQSKLLKIASGMEGWQTQLTQTIQMFEDERVRVRSSSLAENSPPQLATVEGGAGDISPSSSEEEEEEGMAAREFDSSFGRLRAQLEELNTRKSSDKGALRSLRDSLAEVASMCTTLSDLLDPDTSDNEDDVDDQNPLFHPGAIPHHMQSAAGALNRDLLSFAAELEQLTADREHAIRLRRELLFIGRKCLVGALTSCTAITTDLALREREVSALADLAQHLSDPNLQSALRSKIMKEVEDARIDVLDLEDRLQDCRSALVKRRRRNADTQELNHLHGDVQRALRELRVARRKLRKHEAEAAGLMHRLAPELALDIPGVLSPAPNSRSGLVSGAGLPQRILSDYEEITPLDSVEKRRSVGSGGGHRVFTAKYDDEIVVLKGYALVSEDQRSNLERELAILTRARHDAIISARALVHDADADGPILTLYIELPYCSGGNLWKWIREREREMWELQSSFRQLVCGVMHLHECNIVHKDIKPSNVLVHGDGRIILADFDISKDSELLTEGSTARSSCDSLLEDSTTMHAGTVGFMAPELEAGGASSPASDMFSLGCVLHCMHFPDHPTGAIAGVNLTIVLKNAATSSHELADLLSVLLAVEPADRPSASSVLLHPYVNTCHVERLVEEGTLVRQSKKLEAARVLFRKVRDEEKHSGRRVEKWTLRREPEHLVPAVLDGLEALHGESLRIPLRITFEGESGVDEGGILSEMLTVFFEAILVPELGLFETSSGDMAARGGGEGEEVTVDGSSPAALSSAYLPCARKVYTSQQLKHYELIGRAMVKCLLEGRRIGSHFAPSLFKFIAGSPPGLADMSAWDSQQATSLQWILAHSGTAQLFLHFEDLRNSPRGAVAPPRWQENRALRKKGLITDNNKSDYVMEKIQQVLVESRLPALEALRAGAADALRNLSPYAAPFLELLTHSDWRLLLCGAESVSGPQVIALLKWQNFPSASQVPSWLCSLILSFDQDMLRRFIMFVCGCPSLPGASVGNFEIIVRRQAESAALPIAHTCFHQLDIPDYTSEKLLRQKMVRALFEPCFGIV